MNGGKHFTKIDLAQAYNQVTLEEESKELTTINAHKGLYQWTRLPYGVASSPAIFQGTMDKVLLGLNEQVWHLDDKLITGDMEEQHKSNTEEVMSRFKKYGLRARSTEVTQ
uniref:Reverse transcriptase domain-containing protein n=1 Tax=Amphimedon queenslandica TaxID=400682 RepID=A0A1X7UUF7_AMPQE